MKMVIGIQIPALQLGLAIQVQLPNFSDLARKLKAKLASLVPIFSLVPAMGCA